MQGSVLCHFFLVCIPADVMALVCIHAADMNTASSTSLPAIQAHVAQHQQSVKPVLTVAA